MPSYPDSFFAPRTVSNLPGISYEPEKETVGFAEDYSLPSAEILAIQQALGLNPFGSFDTVSERIENIEDQIGVSGTWTPSITFETPGDLSFTPSGTNFGRYLVLPGNMVYCTFQFLCSGFTHTTASGRLRITGLPFLVAFNSRNNMLWSGITKTGYTQMSLDTVFNQTYMLVNACGSGLNVSTVTASDVPSGGSPIFAGSVIYIK